MVSFPVTKREGIFLAVLLLVAFLVRLLLFPLQGYENDTNSYISWFGTAAQYGIRPFYNVVSWCDYPPFNVYIFWAFGSLAQVFPAINAAYIVKLAPTLFDIATSALIYFFVRKHLTLNQSLLATALYAFNPAILFNVAVWGQFDAIYTFFLLVSLIFVLKSKPEASAAVFAVALLTKPQSIALLPLIAFLIYKKDGLKRLATSVVTFVATIFVVILPFQWSNPVTFLSNIYFGAYSGYEFTSINAFNLWGMFGLWMSDSGGLFVVGWALFGVFAAFTLYVMHKRFHVSGEMLIALFAAFMLIFSFFMLPTRIHERYLFPAISLLVLMVPFVKKIRPFYVVLTGTLLVNQAYVLSFLNRPDPFIPQGDLVVLAVSIINLAMFFYATVLMWDELKGRHWLKSLKPESDTPSQSEARGGPPK